MERSSRLLPEDDMMDSFDLHRACRIGDLRAIKRAFRFDPSKVNERDSTVTHTQHGWTPLYRSIICGQRAATKFLLQNGADPNQATSMAETPLHRAADYSQLTLAALLLKFGASPDVQQQDGDTPLHHAAFKGDTQMILLLLSHKADPNIRNLMFSRTPLHIAVDCGHVDSVRALLSAGADPKLTDKVTAI